LNPEKSKNRDHLYLEQELAPQVRFQRVTRGPIVFVGEHL
jgi:hypothetical protein